MNSEIRHHRTLELKQNITALNPVELLIATNNTRVPSEKLRSHLLHSAAIATIALGELEDIPERQIDMPIFKIIQDELLGRVSRETS